MAWNWFVNKRKNQRERFAGPLAIGSLAGVGLLLLVVLYPEKSLLRLLSAPEVSSPAQQRYLETLVQLRRNDTDLIIPLVRSYLAAGCTEKAAKALSYQQGALSKEQTKTIMTLRYELRLQQLELLETGEPEWEQARQNYGTQVEQLLKTGATPPELSRYLTDARRLGDKATASRIEALLRAAVAQDVDPASCDTVAGIALAQGDYRNAAAAYFKGMQSASSLDTKRNFFLSGVRTLQSGNLPQEALVAADRHLGDLRSDRQTLLYLTRLALAANRPERAREYVRRALGMTEATQSHGVAP